MARFNNVHPWFKSYILTHLRWLLLDPRYPPLPFSLEIPLYYISQNYNPNTTLKKRKELSPFLYLRTPKNLNPPLFATSILVDLDNQVALLLSQSHDFVFLVSLFLLLGMGFWAVANSSGGVGGGSLVRLWFDGLVSWLWCWIC